MTDTTRKIRDQLTALESRHEAERQDLVMALLTHEREAATALRASIDPDAGERLAEALEQVERQLAEDRRLGTIYAVEIAELPVWARQTVPSVTPADRAAGRHRVLLHVPRQLADGHRDPVAFAVIDVSDVVFGPGSRARVDRAMAGRVREAEAERERDRGAREREASRR